MFLKQYLRILILKLQYKKQKRTKTMEQSKNTKTKVSYSIDTDILNKFNELAKEKGFNKSQVINILMKRFIEEQENFNLMK